MTRAGDKLYGDWEERARAAAEPFRWRRLIGSLALLAAAAAVFGSALFGFG